MYNVTLLPLTLIFLPLFILYYFMTADNVSFFLCCTCFVWFSSHPYCDESWGNCWAILAAIKAERILEDITSISLFTGLISCLILAPEYRKASCSKQTRIYKRQHWKTNKGHANCPWFCFFESDSKGLRHILKANTQSSWVWLSVPGKRPGWHRDGHTAPFTLVMHSDLGEKKNKNPGLKW